MKGISRFSIVALVVSLLVLFSGGMVADSHAYRGKGGDPMMRQLLRGLGLTDQQRGQIREIVRSHRSELRSGKIEVLKARQDLLTVMASSTYDKDAVNAASHNLANARQHMTDLRARIFRAVITTVLTPDQQVAVQEKIAAKTQRIQLVITRLQGKGEDVAPDAQ
jgi:protein CpxP